MEKAVINEHKPLAKAVLLILCLALILSSIVFAYADEVAESEVDISDFTGVQKFAYSAIEELTKWSAGISSFNLDIDISDSNKSFGEVWSSVKYIYTIIQTIGYALVLMYATSSVVDAVSADRFNWEQLVKVGMKLIVAVLVISHGLEIVEAAFVIGNQLLKDVGGGSFTDEGAGSIAAYNLVKDKNFWECLGALIKTFATIGGTTLISALTIVVVYGRWFRLALLGIFAPIGLADSFNGLHSGAAKYFKRILATSIQGVIIYVIITIETIMKATAAFPLIVGFAALSAVFGSRKWAEQIVGVM